METSTVVQEPMAALRRSLGDLEAQLATWNVPGVQVAVVRDGVVLHADGLGRLAVDSAAKVGPRTLFHHGSCCKAYTALLACLLADEGLLDLDAPIAVHVPELHLPDAGRASEITLRDLLSHRAGLSRHDLTWILNPSWDREELLRRLEHLPLASGLREKMEYSNLGYALAGLVIERITGSTWDMQLRQRILEPLGMSRATTSQSDMRADADAASPHLLRNDTAVLATDRALTGAAPAGGLMTSAEDAARWLLLQLAADPSLQASAVQATHDHQVDVPTQGGLPHIELTGYGLGWILAAYRGRNMVWHSGGIDGFSTQTILLPDQNIGVVVSANLNGTVLPMAAALQLVDTLLGVADEQSWYDLLQPLAAAAAAATVPAPLPDSPAPARPAAELAGTYTHPGYGDLVLTSDGEALRATLGETDLSIRHLDGDTWELRYDTLDAPYALTFETDADGVVVSAVAPLDPTTQPSRFVRRSAR